MSPALKRRIILRRKKLQFRDLNRSYNQYLHLLNLIRRGTLPEVEKILRDIEDPDFKLLKRPTPLQSAIRSKRIDIVFALLNKGVDVNWTPSGGQSVLEIAIEQNNIDLIRLLLVHKANPNDRSRLITPLFLAVSCERFDHIFEELVSAGANVNQTNQAGITALHVALDNLNLPAAERLLQMGVNIDAPDVNGTTPLLQCILRQIFGSVKFLVDCGANLKARDKNNYGALSLAAMSGNHVIMEYLLSGNFNLDANERSYRQRTPLILAAANSKNGGNLVQLLLENGADVSCTDDFGSNCLHANLLGTGSLEDLKTLIDAGADVNGLSDYNDMGVPLHEACRGGHVDKVAMLLEAGANPNLCTKKFSTPLQFAVKGGYIEIVKMLLDHEFDFTPFRMTDLKTDIPDVQGRVPLEHSTGRVQCQIMGLLLEYGADWGIPDPGNSGLIVSEKCKSGCPVGKFFKKLKILGWELPEQFEDHYWRMEEEDEEVAEWRAELEALKNVAICLNPRTTLYDYLQMNLNDSLR